MQTNSRHLSLKKVKKEYHAPFLIRLCNSLLPAMALYLRCQYDISCSMRVYLNLIIRDLLILLLLTTPIRLWGQQCPTQSTAINVQFLMNSSNNYIFFEYTERRRTGQYCPQYRWTVPKRGSDGTGGRSTGDSLSILSTDCESSAGKFCQYIYNLDVTSRSGIPVHKAASFTKLYYQLSFFIVCIRSGCAG